MIRTNHIQFQAMVDYMERHGDLLRPSEGASGRVILDGKWVELRDILNSDENGPHKTLEGWKKVWSDLKTKTKKKAANINTDVTSTCDGRPRDRPLTKFEERVLGVMGVATLVGMQEVEEVELLKSPHAVERSPPSEQHESPPAVVFVTTSLPSLTGASMFEMDAVETFPSQESIQVVTSPSRTSEPSDSYRPRPLRAKRSVHLNNFNTAMSEFVDVENRRLRREQKIDRMRHERDMAMVKHMVVVARSLSSVTDFLSRHYGKPRS